MVTGPPWRGGACGGDITPRGGGGAGQAEAGGCWELGEEELARPSTAAATQPSSGPSPLSFPLPQCFVPAASCPCSIPACSLPPSLLRCKGPTAGTKAEQPWPACARAPGRGRAPAQACRRGGPEMLL